MKIALVIGQKTTNHKAHKSPNCSFYPNCNIKVIIVNKSKLDSIVTALNISS